MILSIIVLSENYKGFKYKNDTQTYLGKFSNAYLGLGGDRIEPLVRNSNSASLCNNRT